MSLSFKTPLRAEKLAWLFIKTVNKNTQCVLNVIVRYLSIVQPDIIDYYPCLKHINNNFSIVEKYSFRFPVAHHDLVYWIQHFRQQVAI